VSRPLTREQEAAIDKVLSLQQIFEELEEEKVRIETARDKAHAEQKEVFFRRESTLAERLAAADRLNAAYSYASTSEYKERRARVHREWNAALCAFHASFGVRDELPY
jgi:hypothetical protein